MASHDPNRPLMSAQFLHPENDDDLDEDPVKGIHIAQRNWTRTSSLDVGWTAGSSWPRSYQRASSYMAGTPLLISPIRAYRHDIGAYSSPPIHGEEDGLSIDDVEDYHPRNRGKRRMNKKAVSVGHMAPWEGAEAERKRIDEELRAQGFGDTDDEAGETEGVSEPTHASANETQTLFNSINVLLGVGVLTVPYAVSLGGWTAVAVLGLLGILTDYTGKLLWDLQRGNPEAVVTMDDKLNSIQQLDDVSGTKSAAGKVHLMLCPSYPDIGELAFGKCGRRVIGVALYSELFSALVLFIILMGTNLVIVLPTEKYGITDIEFMLMSSAILLPACWLRSMAVLSWFSSVGVLSSISLVGAIIVYSFLGDCGGTGNCSSVLEPAPGVVNVSTSLFRDQIDLSLGLLVFCFAGHSVFPEILSSMKTPTKGARVMNYTFLVTTLLYIFLGIVGFLWLGTDAPEQVTQALPQGVVPQIITWLLILSTYTKYALGFNPIASAFEELIPCFRADSAQLMKCASNGRKCLTIIVQIGLRTVLVGLSLVVAVTIPCFGPLSSLVGAVLCCTISLFLPSLLYLKVRWKTLSPGTVGVNIFIMVFAVGAAVAGAYASVGDIIVCLAANATGTSGFNASTASPV